MIIYRQLRRRVVIVGLFIVAVGLVAASDALHVRTEALIVWSEGLISARPLLGMTVFVLLAMFSAMIAFFSSAVLSPVAVYAWGPATCAALLWLGWLLGGMLSYGIGRFLGGRVATALIGEDQLEGWQDQIKRRTRFAHVFLFQALLPSEIPGYVLGTLKYRFSLYVVALALSELPYVISVVFLGEYFLQGKGIVIVLLGVAVAALGLLVTRIRASQAGQPERNEQ